MADEVIYKHPDADKLVNVFFDEELPDDTGMSTLSSVETIDSRRQAYNTLATIATSTLSTTIVLHLANGVAGEDYITVVKGKSVDTTHGAVRIIEVRVRDNHGIGLF